MARILQELDLYYRKRGIHSMEFWCGCRDACASAVPPGGTFTEARSAFVGTFYKDGMRPRLLFLGLDPGEGKGWPCRKQRSPAAIQARIEADPPGQNPHWWGTLRLALRILSSFDSRMRLLQKELQSRMGLEDCRLWSTEVLKSRLTEFRTLETLRRAVNSMRTATSIFAKRSES